MFNFSVTRSRTEGNKLNLQYQVQLSGQLHKMAILVQREHGSVDLSQRRGHNGSETSLVFISKYFCIEAINRAMSAKFAQSWQIQPHTKLIHRSEGFV